MTWGSAQYSYDGRGNLQQVVAGGQTTSYSFDAADRLAGVQLPDGSQVSYGYDAVGRRVRETSGGVTTTRLWDEASPSGDVAWEQSGGGAPSVGYLLAGGELLGQQRGNPPTDDGGSGPGKGPNNGPGNGPGDDGGNNNGPGNGPGDDGNPPRSGDGNGDAPGGSDGTPPHNGGNDGPPKPGDGDDSVRIPGDDESGGSGTPEGNDDPGNNNGSKSNDGLEFRANATYYYKGTPDGRFYVKASFYEGALYLDFSLRDVNTGERHPGLYGHEEFNNIVNHFGLSNIARIRATWVAKSDNLKAFNEMTGRGIPSYIAAMHTWTGRMAASVGFSRVDLQSIHLYGSPGDYKSVQLYFIR